MAFMEKLFLNCFLKFKTLLLDTNVLKTMLRTCLLSMPRVSVRTPPPPYIRSSAVAFVLSLPPLPLPLPLELGGQGV